MNIYTYIYIQPRSITRVQLLIYIVVYNIYICIYIYIQRQRVYTYAKQVYIYKYGNHMVRGMFWVMCINLHYTEQIQIFIDAENYMLDAELVRQYLATSSTETAYSCITQFSPALHIVHFCITQFLHYIFPALHSSCFTQFLQQYADPPPLSEVAILIHKIRNVLKK